MRRSWAGSIATALVATLAHPAWWAMALAAFLVRGGILLVILPIVSIPPTATLMSALAPGLEELALGRGSLGGVVVGTAVVSLALIAVAAAALTGSWLDLALVREAAEDEDIELGWQPVDRSVWQALGIRLAAHVPTLFALGYAIVRTVYVAYDELTAPGDTTLPLFERIAGQAPDAITVLVIAWVVGECVGSLAARWAARGAPPTAALLGSVRQILGLRGLATLGLMTVVVIGALLPFVLATGRAWEHLRTYLLEGEPPESQGAALVLLVATYVLGLAIVGVGLAWRATAWTAEVAGGTGVSRTTVT